MQQTTQPTETQARSAPTSWNDVKDKYDFHLQELQKLTQEMGFDGVPDEEAARSYFQMKFYKKMSKMMHRGFDPSWFTKHHQAHPWHQYGPPRDYSPQDCPPRDGSPRGYPPRDFNPPGMGPHPAAMLGQNPWVSNDRPCGPQWDPAWFEMMHHRGHFRREGREEYYGRHRGGGCGSGEDWANLSYNMRCNMQRGGPPFFAESSSPLSEGEGKVN